MIVGGYGRNGSKACEELLQSGRDFIVIEKDRPNLNGVVDNPDFHLITRDATQEEVLLQPHVEQAAYRITSLTMIRIMYLLP